MDKKTLATLAIGAGIGYYVASSSSTQGTRKKEVRREVVVGPPSGSGPSVDAGGRVVVGKPTSSARSSAARDELQITITDVVFRAEQCFGSLAATVDAAGKTRSYAEFGRRVKALGLAISKELKAPAGARVAILALNSEAYLETYFGVPFSQCLIVSFLNVWKPGDDGGADATTTCRSPAILDWRRPRRHRLLTIARARCSSWTRLFFPRSRRFARSSPR